MPSTHSTRNRRYWDSVAQRNWEEKAAPRGKIRDGFPYLEESEPKIAPYLEHIKGKRIIVLQFGDGLVMLSCAKKGALVTGVDFSREQIRLAKISARECGVNLHLIEADCQDLPSTIPDSHFHIAVAEDGIFSWIEDLDSWMHGVHRVLKAKGRLVVSDHHPMTSCLQVEKGRPRLTASYMGRNPRILRAQDGTPSSVVFLWKLSDIVNAALKAGFAIEHMEEFLPPGVEYPIPRYLLLVARKT